MRSQKQNSERNIQKLKEIEELISQGVNPPEDSRQIGISLQLFTVGAKITVECE